MAPSRHDENNRRPIPQRKWKISEMVTDALGRAGATPNGISLSSMVFGALAGILLAATSSSESERLPWLCAGAALMIVGRLAANMFDGMVAFKFGGTTKIGELYNEVPDRISDTAILIGMGYAAGGTPVLGWVASFFAIFTAYVRTVGKSAGATYDFSGPMAKPQRMVVAIAAAFLLPVVAGSEPYNQVMTWALWLIVGGCVVTVIRRLKNISAELRGGGQARP